MRLVKFCWLVQFCSSLFQWPWKQRLKERLSRCRLKLRDFSIYHIIIYPAVPYNRDFVPFNFFFLIFTLKTFASSYRKMYLEMRRMKNCYSRGINGVSLVRHFLKQVRWPVLLFIFFGTAIGREHWKKNFKNCQITFFFWGITLICQILTAVNVDSSQSDYSVWLLTILSRHSLIIIKFIRTIMHHHKKNNEYCHFFSWCTKAMHIKSTNIV